MAIVLIHVDCLNCPAEFEAEVEIEKGMHAVIEDKLQKAEWLYTRRRAAINAAGIAVNYDGYRCPECADKAEAGPEKPDGEPSNWREYEGKI